MRNVTIIGAGPAGSTAAILLARRGWPVTLVEQHRFPRHKVCGECLSALGVDVIGRLGVLGDIQGAGAVTLNRALLHGGDGASAAVPLPRAMLGISRAALDVILLRLARAAGAYVRQPTRCEAIASAPDGTGVRLRLRDLTNNAVIDADAAHSIIADGKSALPQRAPEATGDFGIKSHWVNVDGPRDAIELFGCAGCYGGLAAIEGERWNAAFSVPAARLQQHCGNVESLFAELVAENPTLARRLRGAHRIGPWLASPLPRFAVRRTWPAGVILVGNAAAALEPIGGEGMGLALRSAELAVDALDRSEGLDVRRLRRAYWRLWTVRRVACRSAAVMASSRSISRAGIDWIGSNPRWGSAAMALMGKG